MSVTLTRSVETADTSSKCQLVRQPGTLEISIASALMITACTHKLGLRMRCTLIFFSLLAQAAIEFEHEYKNDSFFKRSLNSV